MAKKMLFGTKGFETWVNVPRIDPDFSTAGYSNTVELRNGGLVVQNSVMGHKTYDIQWNKASREDIETINAFADGIYGDELIYWIDPMSQDRNLANLMWGTPSIAGLDGVPIFQEQVPTLVENGNDPNRYPRYSAVYRATGVSESFYLPVPPGYCAWVGAHGSATGSAGLRVTPLNGLNYLSPTTLSWLPMSGIDRVNTSFDSTANITGIEISAIETGLLRNLAVNPSAEINLVGFAAVLASGTGLIAQSPGGFAGSQSARVTFTSAVGVASGVSNTFPVEEGKVYAIGGYFRASKITRVQPVVQWLNAAGAVIGSVQAGTQVVTAAAPVWGSAPRGPVTNITAPTGAVSARYTVRSVAGTSYVAWTTGDWIELDAVQVNEGASLQTYTDGSTAGWYWIGAAGNSVSAQTPDTMTFGALIIQILPSGQTPETGAFIPPRGHGGCRFLGKPTLTPHSAKLNLEELSAKLAEVGPWE